MAFLKGIFKKKAGGTAFGNLLRGASGAIAPGILGTGANRIEIGQTKTNAQLAQEAGSYTSAMDNVLAGAIGGAANTDEGREILGAAGVSVVKKNAVTIVLGVVVAILAFMQFGGKGKTKNSF